MARDPHPFARFVNILGRGKSLTRSLTASEAEEAMAMIMAGDTLPEQLGAFLMLLRVKEETAEEMAGFARAVRATLKRPPAVGADLDWPTYSGKRRQLPWYVLAALVLARAGWRIVMHGVEGHTPGRTYTREALARLGLPVANGFKEAAGQMAKCNFAYAPLGTLSPRLAEMFELRPILGVRTCVHTLARLINPFDAPASIQSVFHPGFMPVHRDASLALGQPRMAVFCGEGGEVERRANKPCETMTVEDGARGERRWPPLLTEPRLTPDESMDLDRLGAVWRGDVEDAYATAAITGTLAIALTTLGVEREMASAQARAEFLWRARDRSRLSAAA